MTKDTAIREQARAVFLAALMVLSVMVGTVALSGGAAASANEVNLSDNLAQGNEEVYINGSVDENGTVYAFIDSNGDGYYNDSETQIGSEVIDDHTDDGQYSITFATPSESGTYNVSVVQKQDDPETSDTDESTLFDGDFEDVSTTIDVDADAPVFGDESPEDGLTVNNADADQIVVPIEDANNSVTHVTATVKNSDGDINTWKIDPDSATSDGVSWDSGELSIDPGAGNVPALTDGNYVVSVTAVDTIGNENSTEFTFDVSSNAPTFTDVSGIDGTLTNDENETVEISIDGNDYDLVNSTAELVIENSQGDSVSYDYEDDVYTNGTTTSTFSVDPSADENISAYPDGTYTVTVSAENELGNSADETYTFTVDTDSPSVKNVGLTDAALNNSDISEGDEQVVVTFDEAVDASDVSANVNVDGSSESLTFAHVVDEDSETVETKVVADLSLSTDLYSSVENDSAVVNVTSAQDIAGNSLANADSEDSQASFEIDTEGPSVTLGTVPNKGTLSGYVNVTSLIATQSDVDDLTVEVLAGEDSDATVDITDTADNFDTTVAPDGDHSLLVTVEDDDGNVDTASVDVTFDNGQTLTVNQAYLHGTVIPASVDDISGAEVSIDTDVFNYPSGSADDVVYQIDGEVVTGDDLTLVAEEHRGETHVVEAELNGETRAVLLDFGPVVGAESVEGDTIDIGVTSDETLDTLNVTLETTDDYVEQSEVNLTIDDFEKSELADGSYVYTTTVDDLRDGEYGVSITDSDEGVTVDFDGESNSATVDDEAPSLIDADVNGVEKGQSQVTVTFSEPVENVALDDFSFEGDRASVIGGVDVTPGDGVYTLTFDSEIQTGDDPTLEIDAETYSDAAGTPNEDDSVVVDSIELELTEGANLVSVPVEAGSVSLDSLDLSDVNAIWVYDEGEWKGYDPAAKNDFDKLEAGQGYVVYADSDTSIDARGFTKPAPSNDEIPDGPAVENLNVGWNLVGHFQEGQQSTDRALTTVDYVPEVGVLSQSSQNAFVNATTLEPGEAYWVFVEESDLYTAVNYEDEDESAAPSVSNVVVENDDGSDEITSGDTVSVSATVKDDNTAGVYVSVSGLSTDGDDGVKELTQDGDTSTYDTTFTANDIAEYGEIDLTVTAVDETGIPTEGNDTVSVVDTTIDSASINSPTNGDSTTLNTDESLTVNYDAEDINFENAYVVLNDGSDAANVSASAGTGSTVNVDLSTEGEDVGAGTYDVVLKVFDSAGNSNTVTESAVVTVDDGTIDSALINSPSEGDVTNTDSIEFSASDTNLDTATLTIEDDEGNVEADGVDVTSEGGTYDISDLEDDSYEATLEVSDTAGNSDTATVNFTRDTTVETTDLTATNTESQTVEVVVTADEQLTGLEASDGSGNSVSGIGTDGDFEESTDGDTYTYTATYDAGADDDYTVTLDSATDANDNTDTDSGHSDTVTVGTSG